MIRSKKIIFLVTLTLLALFAGCNTIKGWFDGDDNNDKEKRAATQPILDRARANSSLSTFISLAEQSGLAATLNGPGPITVFIPTNQAFNNLPAGALDNLRQNQAELQNLIRRHMVTGRIFAIDLNNQQSITPLVGGSLPVTTTDGRVQIANANVILPNVTASNGVIHVIDAVLPP